MLNGENYLQDILNYFDLGKLKKFNFLKEGWANHSYLISTNKNENYIVRILKKQTKKGLANEFSIQNQLKKANISTSYFVFNKNSSYFYEKDKIIATVSKMIHGIHPNNSDRSLSYNIGEILASFHTNVKYLPSDEKGWLNNLYVEQELKEIQNNQLRKEIEDLFNKSKKIYDLGLPSGIIHGDLHLENILVYNNKISIFDFEESENNLFIVDIAITIIDLFYRKDIYKNSLIKIFLEGYNSIRKLEKQELENLNWAIKYDCSAMATWLFLNNFEKDGNTVLKIGKEIKKENLTFEC